MLDIVIQQAKDFLSIMAAEIPMSHKINLLAKDRVVHAYEELYYTLSKCPPEEEGYEYEEDYLSDSEDWLREVEMEVMLYYPKWEDILNGGEL